MMNRKIGVLLPQSMSYPMMSKDFMNGLKLACPENFEFKIEGIGVGHDQKKVIDAVQKLINQEDVDLTTGIFGHRNLSEVLDFTESMDHPVIYSDLGAKVPLNLEKRKNVFSNSLDLYGSARALGEHFAQNNFKNIGISSCYYDTGYDFIYGMETILDQYDDMKFAGHFITPHEPRKNEAECLTTFMENAQPDAIFGFFNGIFAEEHAEILNSSAINKDIPIYLTPFSVNDKILEKYPDLFNQNYCVSTWLPELKSKENESFVTGYQNRYNKIPSFFALLGYENGLLISSRFDNSIQEVKGPRGVLNNESEENRTTFPQYLWQIDANEEKQSKTNIEIMPSPKTKSVAELDSQSGWENAYLCS